MRNKIVYLVFVMSFYSMLAFSQNCSLSFTVADATCDQLGSATVVPSKKCVGPFTYLWSNGGTTATITNLTPGTYSVTVTESSLFTVTGSVVVGYNFSGSSFPIVPANNQGGNEVIKDICVSQSDGAVYVIGYFTKDIFYGTNYELTNNSNYRAIFAAKYNRCGVLQNAVKYGYADNDETNLHIEMLSNGLLAIAGDFDNTISFDGGSTNYNTQGGTDVFLAIISPTTLYVTSSSNVRHMCSTNNDRAKGFTAVGNSVAITGSFVANGFTDGNTTLTLHSANYTDLFVGRYDYTTQLDNNWLKNYYSPLMLWHDRGMATAYINDGSIERIYFTFQLSNNNYTRSYIASLNASNGNNFGMYQLNFQSGDFHEIMDMKAYNNDLYLCGQYYFNSTPSQKDAVVYYYSNPNSNGLSGGPTDYVLSTGQSGSRNCIANRLVVNNNGVYVVGTFNQSNFLFSGGSGPISPYGTSHYAARLTHTTLNQDWITGIENGGTGGVSFGNGFDMDVYYGAYYVGGTFTGIVSLETGNINPLTMTATSLQDAYLARFIDNGFADYRKKPEQFIEENTKLDFVYPNPAYDVVNIYTGIDIVEAEVTFTDMLGRVAYKYKNQVNITGCIVINTSNLPANTYFISVDTGSEVNKYKVVLLK